MAKHDALDCECVYGNNQECGGQNIAFIVTEDGLLQLICNKCGEDSYVRWTYQEYRERKNKKDNADRPVIKKRK